MSLQTSNLFFQYNSANSWEFPDIELTQGQNLLILGNSGRGKTTLLHLLAGLLKADSGQIKIDGVDQNQLSKKKREQFRARNIGIVFQRSYFVKALNVRDNLLLAQKLAGRRQDLAQVSSVLSEMGLAEKINSSPQQLSIGEQQRVSIARAVLNEPKVIFADEPTSALDDENTEAVINLLESTARRHQANLVVVTHDSRLKNHFQHSISL